MRGATVAIAGGLLFVSACRTESVDGALPATCTLAYANDAWPMFDPDLIRQFSVSQVVVDGDLVVIVIGSGYIALTEGEEYAFSGQDLAVSRDGGASFRTLSPSVPNATSFHAHDGRLYALERRVDATRRDQWRYAVRPVDLTTAAVGPPIGGDSFPSAGRLSLAGARIASFGDWYGTLTWGEVDLDAGTTTERRTEQAPHGGVVPYRSHDGGETWHALSWTFDGDSRCHHRATPRETGPDQPLSIASECDGAIFWPGGPSPWDASIPTEGHDLRVYERDEHLFGSPFYEGANPRRELHLGEGRLASISFDPHRTTPLLPGLIGLATGDDGDVWFLGLSADDRRYEVDLPPLRCGPCFGVETLLAVRPLDPTTREVDGAEMLVVTQVDLGDPGYNQYNVCARTEVMRTRPARDPSPPPHVRQAPFLGCDEPLHAPTALDHACAMRTSCYPNIEPMPECVAEFARAEPARLAAFMAATDCDDHALWAARPYAVVSPDPCDATVECQGDRITHCSGPSDDLTAHWGYDCAPLGIRCEDPDGWGGHTPTCTQNLGCDLMGPVDKGVCQGDLIVYEALGSTRYVDCAALGLGTCHTANGGYCAP